MNVNVAGYAVGQQAMGGSAMLPVRDSGGEFNSLMQQAEALVARLNELTDRSDRSADLLLGTQPAPPGGGGAATPQPDGFTGMMGQLLSAAHHRLDQLEAIASRLGRAIGG